MAKIGENIILNKYYNNVLVRHKSSKVLAPARLHITEMNPHNMVLEKLGGGGIGIALNSNNIINIEVIEGEEDIILHSKKAVIQHFIIIMRKLFNSKVHFKVNVQFDDNMEEHNGLASNAMLSNAVIYGINFIFGNILTKNEIVEILDDNFVEESEGLLVKDICTGIAHNICCHGGLCIVSSDGKLIKKYNLPNYLKIFLIKTNKKTLSSNIEREKNIVDLLKVYNKDTYLEKSYNILNNIIPDLEKGSIDKLFKYNYIFQHYNDDKNVLDHYLVDDIPVRELLKKFEIIPNTMTGLSTNAKYVYIITSDEDIIKNICILKNLDYHIYSINNNGVTII